MTNRLLFAMTLLCMASLTGCTTMKNAYADLEKVLQHYGYTFDDVVVENIYTKTFPTGTWLEVKGLALPEFMIEIELEAHRSPARR